MDFAAIWAAISSFGWAALWDAIKAFDFAAMGDVFKAYFDAFSALFAK